MSHYFWMRVSFRGIRGGVNGSIDGGGVSWPQVRQEDFEKSSRDQESAASFGEDWSRASFPEGMPAFKRPSR